MVNTLKYEIGDYISYSYSSYSKPVYAKIIRKSECNRDYVVINDYNSDTNIHIWIGNIIKKFTKEEFFWEML